MLDLVRKHYPRLQTIVSSLLLLALLSPPGAVLAAPYHQEAQTASLAAAPNDACFTVSGNVTRMERTPAASGWGAPVTGVPVHDAVIKVMERDTFFDDNYGETTTDQNGNYRFDEFCDDDGLIDNTLEVYVELRAEIRVGGDTVVEVEDSSWVDEVYEYQMRVDESDSGGTYTVDFVLDETQSGVFNIADSILDAWNFWNENGGAKGGDTTFDYAAEVHWEPGYGDEGSYYRPVFNEITMADNPNDVWDDSVIIHEWGHMSDDKYGCDDADGGEHFFSRLYSPELAWSEGWASYLQSAVRTWRGDADGNLYIDADEGSGFGIDLETWDVGRPNLVSSRNEVAVAALLWDLAETNIDGQDTVTYEYGDIQDLYTDSAFTNNGFFDDDCDAIMFSRIWVDTGRPADGPTAAVFEQNIGLTFLTGTRAGNVHSASAFQQAQQLSESQDDDYKWWDQTLFVVDNSASMGEASKLDAVKSVIRQQASELEAAQPKGVEFNLQTFSNGSQVNTPIFSGQFFSENITPFVDGVTAAATLDPDCPVQAFDALAQALEGERDVDAWLYTDGDTVTDRYSVETMQRLLTDRNARASYVSLGTCAPVVAVDENQLTDDNTGPYLQTPPQSPTGGIVPYLMTAIGSGGQFLSVNESQLADAQKILLAQVTHSAGAGRWSDYVSNSATYRFDVLTADEYEWLDVTDGQNDGKPGDNDFGDEVGRGSEGFVDVDLQTTVDFYGAPVDTVRVFENGAIVTSPAAPAFSQTVAATNQPFSDVFQPNRAMVPFWDDLEWDNRFLPDGGGPLQSGAGYQNYGNIYSKLVNRWQVIQYFGFGTADNVTRGSFGPDDFVPEEFEVLINIDTGEIRYQYRNLESGVGGATIGLRGNPLIHGEGIQVAHNNTELDLSNSGYKFIPVPPQPTKTYTVAVDSAMEGIGFLLTGYSGSFEPLVVRDPNGTEIDLSDSANVLALNLGLVQYVQVDVDGRIGNWSVDVMAGDTGSGTFAFSSMAASAITAHSPTSRNLATNDVHTFLIEVEGAVDNNQLLGYLRTPQGEPFGAQFALYDDGQHGDEGAGDGLFGSDAFGVPGAGPAYLLVEGTINGETFLRSDSSPFNFQPLSVKSLGDGINTGGATILGFEVRNDDTENRCYTVKPAMPSGWSALFSGGLCLDAGETQEISVSVYMGPPPLAGPPPANEEPSGTQGRVVLSVVDDESGEITAADSALVTRVRDATVIEISNRTRYLRPNGDQAPLRISAFDEQGYPAVDGTEIQLSTSLGSLPPIATTIQGSAFVTFTTTSDIGEALITAAISNTTSATTTIDIANALPNQIELTTASNSLAADGEATTMLTATIRDRWGDPVANWPIRIGVEGGGDTEHDPAVGTVNDVGHVDMQSDSNGQVMLPYTAGTQPGEIRVRADLLVEEGDGFRTANSAAQLITLTGAGVTTPTPEPSTTPTPGATPTPVTTPNPTDSQQPLYLPLIYK